MSVPGRKPPPGAREASSSPSNSSNDTRRSRTLLQNCTPSMACGQRTHTVRKRRTSLFKHTPDMLRQIQLQTNIVKQDGFRNNTPAVVTSQSRLERHFEARTGFTWRRRPITGVEITGKRPLFWLRKKRPASSEPPHAYGCGAADSKKISELLMIT